MKQALQITIAFVTIASLLLTVAVVVNFSGNQWKEFREIKKANIQLSHSVSEKYPNHTLGGLTEEELKLVQRITKGPMGEKEIQMMQDIFDVTFTSEEMENIKDISLIPLMDSEHALLNDMFDKGMTVDQMIISLKVPGSPRVRRQALPLYKRLNLGKQVCDILKGHTSGVCFSRRCRGSICMFKAICCTLNRGTASPPTTDEATTVNTEQPTTRPTTEPPTECPPENVCPNCTRPICPGCAQNLCPEGVVPCEYDADRCPSFPEAKCVDNYCTECRGDFYCEDMLVNRYCFYNDRDIPGPILQACRGEEYAGSGSGNSASLRFHNSDNYENEQDSAND